MTTSHITNMKKNISIIFLLALCHSLFSQEWTVQIEMGNTWAFNDVIAVDEGVSALCVGGTTNMDGLVVKIDKHGEHVERLVHLPGMMLGYYSAVQLDNGDYMVFGVCDDSLCNPRYRKYIHLDVFDSELERVSSRTYSVEDETFECFYIIYGMKLNSILSPTGTVILAATPAYLTGQGYYREALQLYELDEQGDILARKSLPTNLASSVEEITYEPHSNYMLMAVEGGSFPSSTGVPGIYVIDANLDIVSSKDMVKVQGGYAYQVDAIHEITTDGTWIDGDRLILNTIKSHHNRPTFYYSSLYVIDSALNVYDELRLPPYDSCAWMPMGTSTAYVDDSTVFAITYCAEDLNSGMFQANIILVDKHLNLLGRKTFKDGEFLFKPGQPAVFNDGGCLVPMYKRRGGGEPLFKGCLMKFRRTDIEITWDVVREDWTEASLSPYPNPTGGIVNIPIPDAANGNARILLFDAKGMKCLDSPVGKDGNLVRLDTSNLEPGLYIYRIDSGNGKMTEGKFVKQ